MVKKSFSASDGDQGLVSSIFTALVQVIIVDHLKPGALASIELLRAVESTSKHVLES